MMHNTLHPYLLPLKEAFLFHADDDIARAATAYMKHQSVFFGIKAPVRRLLLKEFVADHGLPDPVELAEIVQSAWQQPEREFQYAAMELAFKCRKKSRPEIIKLFEFMITHKSWWDTVDYIAPNLVGDWFRIFPDHRERLITNWMQSGNIWLQRSCLLFQLKYKNNTDRQLLFQLAGQLAVEKEFFIRKAIGWALREYAKTNPEQVRSFVANTNLSGLSRREALKHIS